MERVNIYSHNVYRTGLFLMIDTVHSSLEMKMLQQRLLSGISVGEMRCKFNSMASDSLFDICQS